MWAGLPHEVMLAALDGRLPQWAYIERWCKSLVDQLQHDLAALGAGGEHLRSAYRQMTWVNL